MRFLSKNNLKKIANKTRCSKWLNAMKKTQKNKEKRKKKPLSFKKRKFYITMRKIVCRKSSRKSHKKQETPFFADSKKRQSQKCRSTKKIVFWERKKTQKKTRIQNSFYDFFQKAQYCVNIKKWEKVEKSAKTENAFL